MKLGRRFWFSVHSWVGLKLSIATSFIFLTGTLAVFGAELDWIFYPEMRANPLAEQPRVSWGELYNAARAAYPEGRVFALERHEDSWFAANAEMVAPWDEHVRMWFNPYTAEYQGSTPWFSLQSFFRRLHSSLMLPSKVGLLLVTSLSFVILASLVTGLLTYKTFWQGFFKKPRFDHSPRVWLGDLHRLSGVWSIWILVIFCATTIYYFAERIDLDAPALPQGEQPVKRSEIVPESLTGKDIDLAVTKAVEEIPGLSVMTVLLPGGLSRPIVVEGHATAVLVRQRANAVFIDPTTLEKLGMSRGEELSPHQRISEAVDPLHFGTWGGLASRIVWFVFGLILFGLSIMGAAIYGQRAIGSLEKKEAS